MLGIGKHLWTRKSGDRFAERLRSEDAPPPFEVGWTPRRANNRRLELRSASRDREGAISPPPVAAHATR